MHAEVLDKRRLQLRVSEGNIVQFNIPGQLGIVDIPVTAFCLRPGLGFHGRRVRIFHDVLYTLHVGAHLLQHLSDGYQTGHGGHECTQEILKSHDHTNCELSFHCQIDTQYHDHDISSLRQD